MLSTATCVACQFPLSPEDKVCPRCGRPVALLDSSAGADAPKEAPRNGDTPLNARLGGAPSLGSSFRPAPLRSFAPRTEPIAEVADEAGTAASMPTAAPDSGSANLTGSIPTRPAGSADTLRTSEYAPRPWQASNEYVPVADPAPSTPSYLITAPPAEPVAPAPAPAPLLPVVTSSSSSASVTPASAVSAADAAKNTAGALVLLPGEELIMQLGALYLTNRRAILYAPTILRSAFLRDVDAIGTLTERSSGWIFFLALLMLVLAGGGIYMLLLRTDVNFLGLGTGSLALITFPLAILGLILLVTYFFWIKRSLFLSVGGRPLIVVSISAWNQRKLDSVDNFVNAFSQAKDNIEREDRQAGRL